MSISNLPADMLTASYIGKTLFRSLANGHDFVTPLQVSRLVQNQVDIPKTVLCKSKYSQEDMVSMVSMYMNGDMPQMKLCLRQTFSQKMSKYFILFPVIVSVFYFYSVFSLSIKLWSTLATYLSTLLLLMLTISTRATLEKLLTFKMWSNILSQFKEELDFKSREEKFLLKQLIFTFILVFTVISIPPIQPAIHQCIGLKHSLLHLYLYATILIGSALSFYNIQKPSRTFFLILIGNMVVCASNNVLILNTDIGKFLLTLQVPFESVMFVYSSLVTVYFVTKSVFFGSRSDVILEIQALSWNVLGSGLFQTSPDYFHFKVGFIILITFFLLPSSSFANSKKITVLIFWMCLTVVFVVTSKYSVSFPIKPLSQLKWDQYQSMCVNENSGDVSCQKFNDLKVSWCGSVENVGQERNNFVEDMLTWIPDIIRRTSNLDCVLGDR